MNDSPASRGFLLAAGAAVVVSVILSRLFAPPRIHALTPCRVFDTRAKSAQTTGAALETLKPHLFRVQGSCGVPDGARAVFANVTVVSPSQWGDLRLAGPDLVILTATATPGTVHLLFDVTGYLK